MMRRSALAWLFVLGTASACLSLDWAAARPARAQSPSPRPWLGVSMGRDPGSGVLVDRVVHGSPADLCGLHAGDRIIRVGAARVATGEAVVEAVAAHSPGDALAITYVREGHEVTVVAHLTPFPQADEMLRMDLVGKPAPAWDRVTFVKGAAPSTATAPSDARGHVVVLDFWATWCVPCRMAMPNLSHLQDRYGAEGLSVVGLSSEEAAPVLAYVRRESPRYSVALDTDAETTRRYGVISYPTVVVIDRHGTVRDVYVGYDSDEGAHLEATVAKLLAEH
ncbi:MAG: redoxin family protein [Polyangiaceae bacterium]